MRAFTIANSNPPPSANFSMAATAGFGPPESKNKGQFLYSNFSASTHWLASNQTVPEDDDKGSPL